MNKRNLIVVIAILTLAVTIIVPILVVAQGSELQPGPATIKMVVGIRSFAIKAEANPQADTIVEIFEGQSVTVIEVVRISPTSSWAHVTYDGFEGWLPTNVLVNAEESTGLELDPVILEQNIEIGRRVVEEIWGGEDLEVGDLTSLYADSFMLHALGQASIQNSGFLQTTLFIDEIHNIWPDLEIVIRNISANADTVTMHLTMRGTFSNASQPESFLDRNTVSPTNEQGIWDFVIIERIENAQIVEEWWFWNRELIEHVLGADGTND